MHQHHTISLKHLALAMYTDASKGLGAPVCLVNTPAVSKFIMCFLGHHLPALPLTPQLLVYLNPSLPPPPSHPPPSTPPFSLPFCAHPPSPPSACCASNPSVPYTSLLFPPSTPAPEPPTCDPSPLAHSPSSPVKVHPPCQSSPLRSPTLFSSFLTAAATPPRACWAR